MEDYMHRGFLREAESTGRYIVPHHAVVKDSSVSTKLRVVFDFSCSTQEGSLNDHLLVGPKLQTDIADVLLNFRQYKIAFTADIIKMFPNISMHPQDRAYQHVYWRSEPSLIIKEYELTILSFGLSCAPYLALRVMRQLKDDEGSGDLSRAASRLATEMYVDDLVTGDHTLDGAADLQRQFISLLGRAEFQLSKWASNSTELLKSFREDEKAQDPVIIASDEQPSVNILGLQWNHKEDVFSYRIKVLSQAKTKRTVLSQIASLYDPLGFLAPSIFHAKLIMQDIFKHGRSDKSEYLDWDDPLPAYIQDKWHNFVSQLSSLEHVSIPRYLTTPPTTPCQVVGFSDASEAGYAAALYLRVSPSGKVFLLKAKSRVAPLKQLTVPRLELCGALLLAQIYSSVLPVIKQFHVQSKHLFTDSTTVLGWLRTPSYKLKIFIANRVEQILEHTTISDWSYVATEQNPADCASRGVLPDLVNHPLWWHGPGWLRDPIDEWPHFSSPIPSDLPELKPNNKVLMLATSPADKMPDLLSLIDKSSSYSKLVRCVAYVLRFIHRCRHPQESSPLKAISSTEFRSAIVTCVKQVQASFYKGALDSKEFKPLVKLSPFRDEDGVLRVGGRLGCSSLSQDQKHPFLLSATSRFAYLVVLHFHERFFHPGPSLLTALIRNQFWIPSSRNLVRKICFQCVRCYKQRAQTLSPVMGQIPESRFKAIRPFLHVGIDFAGPFLIRNAVGRKVHLTKCYVCIFVCFSVKAYHLELVTDLSTPRFRQALDRFIARRGLPEKIFTDNGTNFVGAANQLKELYTWLRSKDTQQKIIDHLTPRLVEWVFIPPSAPNFGGLWEAGVKAVKRHLGSVMTEQRFTYEELLTILTRIEALLNRRPLCPISEDDTEDCSALTPGHFLIGSPSYVDPRTEQTRHTRYPAHLLGKGTSESSAVLEEVENRVPAHPSTETQVDYSFYSNSSGGSGDS